MRLPDDLVMISALTTLLAAQISTQAWLMRQLSPPNALLSAVTFLSEVIKMFVCLILYAWNYQSQKSTSCLSVSIAVRFAAIPAAIYSIQNLAASYSQKHLSVVVYNLLNQSKVLSSALMGYIILGRRQSSLQLYALLLVFFGAVLAVMGSSQNDLIDSSVTGIICALVASGLSGLSGSLADAAIQDQYGDAIIFSAHISFFVLMTMTIGFFTDFLVRGDDSDVYAIYTRGGFLSAAGINGSSSLGPLIPILSSSIGGILVGQVTKMVGSVRKGLAVSAGVVLSAFLDRTAVDISIISAVGVSLVGVVIHSLESAKLKKL